MVLKLLALAVMQRRWRVTLWGGLVLVTLAYGHLTYRSLVSRNAAGPLNQELPLPADRPVTFFLLGDTGMGNDAQRSVAKAMEARCQQQGAPIALILLGDNFYQNGVSGADDDNFRTKFAEPYGSPCLANIPTLPILGNHDHKGNAEAQVQYSRLNPRWRMPGRMYTASVGRLVQFFALDTNKLDLFIPTWGGFRNEVMTAMQNSQARWRIALGHHPFASGCSDRPYREDIWRSWGIAHQLCGKVDTYVTAHTHFLEHVYDRELCPAHSFISGAGGAKLRAFDHDHCESRTAFAKSTHGFLQLTAQDSHLQWEFIDSDGTSLYSYRQLPERTTPSVSL